MMTSQEAQQEAEDLTNLVKSPGWQRFCAVVVTEAQASVEQEMSRALEDSNDQVAAGRMRQCIASKRGLERAVRWPDERLKALSGLAAQQVTTTGPMSVTSRRGSL